MTTHSARPGYHISTKSLALAFAGTALAGGAALGIAGLFSTDVTTQAPVQDLPQVVITDGARDSWEGRIGSNADQEPGGDTGVRDSWMPPGSTDRELR